MRIRRRQRFHRKRRKIGIFRYTGPETVEELAKVPRCASGDVNAFTGSRRKIGIFRYTGQHAVEEGPENFFTK